MTHSELQSQVQHLPHTTNPRHKLTEADKLRFDVQSHYSVDPLRLDRRRTTRSHTDIENITEQVTEHTTSSVQPHSLLQLTSSTIASNTIQQTEEEIIEEQYRLNLDDEEYRLFVPYPGQTTSHYSAPIREVFEYAYRHFTDGEVRRFLNEVQPWIQFRRKHKRKDLSLPILDCEGNSIDNLQDSTPPTLDDLPVNREKLNSLRLLITSPASNKDTRKPNALVLQTSQADQVKPSTANNGVQEQNTPVSKTVTNNSKPSLPPNQPQPEPQESSSSTNSTPPHSPTMADLKYRNIFFPPQTFDGTDCTQTISHVQAFDDFAARQKLTEFEDIKNYFEMTLRGIARDWL